MSKYAHLSTLDPEFAELLTKTTVPTLDDVYKLRELSKSIPRLSIDIPETELKVENQKITVQDVEIAIRTFVPQSSDGRTFPLLFWTHGGGFVSGSLDFDNELLQEIAVEHKVSIVHVNHRLAPEYPFPTGLNDAYEALKWAYAHAKSLRVDFKKGFLVGGTSAGANFAAVLAHRVRDDPAFKEKLTGQILQIPNVLHWDLNPEQYKNELLSKIENKNAPVLAAISMRVFMDAYKVPNPADPDMSPLLLPSHGNLPPAYFQICGMDPLRDEGFLYEKLISEKGIRTKVDVYPGLPHGFHGFAPQLEKTAAWYRELKAGVKWLLELP